MLICRNAPERNNSVDIGELFQISDGVEASLLNQGEILLHRHTFGIGAHVDVAIKQLSPLQISEKWYQSSGVLPPYQTSKLFF